MKKRILWFVVALIAVVAFIPTVYAQSTAAAGSSGVDWIDVAASLGLGFAALGCGIGQGKATASACEGMARNPGIAGAIRITLIIGLAFIESLTLYVVARAFVK